MLQKLVELALDLCLAGTSGISLLDDDAFRWEAVAGALHWARGRRVPRDEAPSALCIDDDCTLLLHLPDRCFPALRDEPRLLEALVIPFHARGMPIGTVWVVSHSVDRKFDGEDERIIQVLADFASAGWQLWKAYDAVADDSQRKDTFLATLGHELRNPLAAISAAASVLRQEVTANARAERAVDVLARQSRHLARLADDLLDAGRVASGKLRLETRRVNLVEIVSDAIETCRGKIDERALGLTIDLSDRPIWIEGDAVRLTQAFCNLIDNATKYTPRGGRIAVAAYMCEKQVEIAISDTGQGIHPDHLELIFEQFAQLSEGRGPGGVGLGLGLSLVRSVVELHGGTVKAHSDGPAKGSRFTVRLPQPEVKRER
jgi:signal transduction histidine kinase